MPKTSSTTMPAAGAATRRGSASDPRVPGRHCPPDAELLVFIGHGVTAAKQLPEERRAELQNHFGQCRECRQRAQDLSASSDSDIDSDSGGLVGWSRPALPVGAILAQRYRVCRFIGRGGMGEVYEAEDSLLGKRVALKTVSSLMSGDPESLTRLRAEVQLAHRVSHRNVCRIFDLGVHRELDCPPLFFLTMELIAGQTLAAWLRERPPLSIEEVARIGEEVLLGLEAAHEAGVIHRDLKTDNVMLREGSGSRSVVLMDFGLASALHPDASRISSDQALVGSLAYMAPEQVQGEELRPSTDLYAVGVMLFEMLAGRMPFAASTPAAAALKRLQSPAPPLSECNPEIPNSWVRFVARCLERAPEDRFRSVASALLALREARQESEPSAVVSGLESVVPAARRTSLPTAARTVERKGIVLGWRPWALAAALLGLLFGMGAKTLIEAREGEPGGRKAASATQATGGRGPLASSVPGSPLASAPAMQVDTAQAAVMPAASSSAQGRGKKSLAPLLKSGTREVKPSVGNPVSDAKRSTSSKTRRTVAQQRQAPGTSSSSLSGGSMAVAERAPRVSTSSKPIQPGPLSSSLKASSPACPAGLLCPGSLTGLPREGRALAPVASPPSSVSSGAKLPAVRR